MKAIIVTIGDELLIGQVIDSNSAFIGSKLEEEGIQVLEICSVSDQKHSITSAVDRALKQAEIVILSGGLGPTRDDITKLSLAEYFNTTMEFSEYCYQHIEKFFEKRGRKPGRMHREQSFMPASASLFENKKGTAPGIYFEKEGRFICSLPGVPDEMKDLLTKSVIPYIKANYKTGTIHHHTFLTIGYGETQVAHKLEEIELGLEDDCKIAYLPSLGSVRVRLSMRNGNESRFYELLESIKNQLGVMLYGEGADSLETIIGKILIERGQTLGCAESCTGGKIAARIVSKAGASAFFEGGVVAYSYDLKERLLGVKKETLNLHGAVSHEVVREMALGARDRLGVDYSIAVSGIAGPGGATDEKPVGTVYAAVAGPKGIESERWQLGNGRERNLERTVIYSLNMLRKFLLEA